MGVHLRQVAWRSEVDQEKVQIVLRQDVGGGNESVGILIGISFPELLACLHPYGLKIATLPRRRTRPSLEFRPTERRADGRLGKLFTGQTPSRVRPQIPAVFGRSGGGETTGLTSTDSARRGIEHHVLLDGQGMFLTKGIIGDKLSEVRNLLPLVAGHPTVRGKNPSEIQAETVLRGPRVRFRIATRTLGLNRDRTVSGKASLRTSQWVPQIFPCCQMLTWLAVQTKLTSRSQRPSERVSHQHFSTRGQSQIITCSSVLFDKYS